jgi:hypothetical protein
MLSLELKIPTFKKQRSQINTSNACFKKLQTKGKESTLKPNKQKEMRRLE